MAVTRIIGKDILDATILDDDISPAANIVGSKILAATTSARGTVQLATDGQWASGVAVQGNDRRLIPTGLIVMWHGLISNIPSGWIICDGTYGTPDLRSKFVRGAPAGQQAGGTGGSGSHSHNMMGKSGSSAEPHTHALSATTGTASTAGGHTVCGGTESTVASAPPHTHCVSGTTSQSSEMHDHAINFWSAACTMLPPYYDVIFIMKQ